MFSFVKGQIDDINGNNVVVDVGGVGYELLVSDYTLKEVCVGRTQKLYTFLQVKEDGVSLFGFSSKEEKNMFLLLTSVSGVGCKMAISILSGMDFNGIAAAIFNCDTKQLTKIKGLGKKTAERIVLELKEKVTVDINYIGSGQQSMNFTQDYGDNVLTNEQKAAISVLCSLGKSQVDAEKLVEAASKLGASSSEELINMAFRIN